jgi:hypothetical protein
MEAQVRADGSHFEQSSYYHVYALDMLLFSGLLEEMPPGYYAKLAGMAEYLDALLGPSRKLPLLGDDDGGRFFHPYGARDGFGRASLALCGRELAKNDSCEIAAWWPEGHAIVPPASGPVDTSRLFEDAGIAVMRSGPVHIVADVGPFGPGGAGHSHSDTLSFVVRNGSEELLVDAGTFTYVSDPKWRNWFRGSAAHNTIRIDEIDQGEPAGPFRWASKPAVEIGCWRSDEASDYLDATALYSGFRHCRRWLLLKPDLLFVLDEVAGPAGEHLIEQFWHAGLSVNALSPRSFGLGSGARLLLSHDGEASEGGEHGWRSRALRNKEAAPVIRAAVRCGLPVQMGAVLDFSPGPDGAMELAREGEEALLVLKGARAVAVQFTEGGAHVRP